MEPLLNGVIGILTLLFGAVRGLLGSNPILTGLGAGVGAYLGVRAAHQAVAKSPAPQARHP
jgi:hypothetical protein